MLEQENPLGQLVGASTPQKIGNSIKAPVRLPVSAARMDGTKPTAPTVNPIQQAAKLEPLIIDGVRYQNLPDKPYPNPLTMLAGGMGSTLSFIANAGFESRADQRLAANRADLNNDTAATPLAANWAAPTVPPSLPASVNPLLSPRRDSGVITAESAAAASTNPMTRSGGVFGTYDGKGVNDILARENAARAGLIDSMIKAQGGNGSSAMPDLTNEDNEKLQAMKLSPQEYLQWQLAKRGQENAMQQFQGGQQVAMRGQDIAAQSEAAKLAGNPLNQAILGQQVAGLQAQNESAKMLQEIQKKAIAGDAQAIEVYKALTGKTHQQNPLVVPGGEYSDPSDPTGQTKLKNPSAVYDPATGQWHTMQEAGKAPTLAVPPPEKRVVGTTYDTPKGKMIWRGSGWEAVVKPTYDQFAAQMKQRHGNKVTDAEIQKAYAQQFGATSQAPASAIDYLTKNPDQAVAFKSKYGYLPEGF